MKKQYRFIIKVRAGQAGFADDEEYESSWFDSFEKCYNEYITFNPSKSFSYLRHVQKEIIQYKVKNIIHDNEAKGGLVFYNEGKIVDELGITEDEFDSIIDKIENKQKKKT